MAKVFISYAREDYESAKRLYDYLLSQGHEPWLDRECLLPGQKWQGAIQSAIRDSHFFITLLSPNSVEKRGYVQKEIRAGLDMLDQIPDSQVFLIPARISECEPKHDRLKELQWVDLFPSWEDGLERISKVFSFVPIQIRDSSLAGSKWLSTETLAPKKVTYHLISDGVLEYEYEDNYFRDGTWKQSGNIIYMEFNKSFAQYKGIVEGDRIAGEAQNLSGAEWRWTAIRIT